MQTRINSSRPPVLNIQRVKSRAIQQHHKHDTIPAHQYAPPQKNPLPQPCPQPSPQPTSTKRPRILSSQKSLEQSIIMLDTPEVQEVGTEKNIQELGCGFKIMRVECGGDGDRGFGGGVGGVGVEDRRREHEDICGISRRNVSYNILPTFATNQKNNPETHDQTRKSNSVLQGLPELKKFKAMSFKKQSLDLQGSPELTPQKNPECLTDSSLNKNQSNRRIIFSQSSQTPKDHHQPQNILFSFLPINSVRKDNPSSESNLPVNSSQISSPSPNQNRNNKDDGVNQNVYTPEPKTRFKKKDMAATIDFFTRKKEPVHSMGYDGRTEAANGSEKVEQIVKQKVITENNQDDGGLFEIFKILMPPQEKNEKRAQISKSRLISSSHKDERNINKTYSSSNLQHRQSEEFKKLKTAMTNQKNLKLKDYLRLTSLSNDSKFDKMTNNLRASNIKNQNHLSSSNHSQSNPKHFLFDKNRTAIDPQKSITLIKASLRRKLEKSIAMALKIVDQVGEDRELLGTTYEDLVFMCNFNKVFDQNLFKTVNLLEDLLDSYKNKRLMGEIMENDQKLAELKMKQTKELKQIFSPLKKGKKKNENLQFKLIQRLLKNINIIPGSPTKAPNKT